MNEDRTTELVAKKKAQKDYPDFTDAVDGLGTDELESNLVRYAKYREQTELTKKKDEELERAQNAVKELMTPYNEILKALKVKMAYINILMEELAPVEDADQEG